MKKINLFSLVFFLSSSLTFASDCESRWSDFRSLDDYTAQFKGECDQDLKNALKQELSTNKDLGYTGARKIMFSKLDNIQGEVCGVYSSLCVVTDTIPNATIMNCEHTWPQSMGAVGIAKSDLHHLFPVDSKVNSRRSNYPFCEVTKISWEGEKSLLGFSEFGTRCFEPPADHKGDVARAMLYFSVRYGKTLDKEQEDFFKKWNEEDPVSDYEIERNNMIDDVQGNRNIFVDYPEMIELISDF